MTAALRILSYVIILLGLVHISFAFPILDLTIDLLWFIGAGFTICFAGVINLLVLNKTASKPSQVTAFVCNALVCVLFILAQSVLHEPQVYFGIVLFLLTSAGFITHIGR